MASAPSPARVPKPKGIQPSHYFESFLEKKGPCDQGYRRFWAGLHGLIIYFYSSNRDFQHLEKLDLRTFVKLTDEAPQGISCDPGIHFSLVLRDQEIKFKAESLESREMWKGFILTVVELRVPSKLTLLPGHLYMMAEVLTKEEARRSLETPLCFLKVSRLEAQLLLERYPECGNLLLRPSGDGKDGVSVTTRQLLNGTPVVRHYKVKHEGAQYVIDVEDPFSCSSLDAVVNYFVSHTKNALVPFVPNEDYEKVLGYVDADKENGESVWMAPSASEPGPGPAPPAGGPKSLLPAVSSQNKLPPLPPPPRLPSQDDNYVTPIDEAPAVDYVNQDVPSSGQPVVPKPRKLAKTPVKPPKLPTGPKPGRAASPVPPASASGQPCPPSVFHPEPKGDNRALAKKLVCGSPQAVVLATMLGNVTSSSSAELEEKLQKRRALEQ